MTAIYDPNAPLYDRLMTYIDPDDDQNDHGTIRMLMTEAAQAIYSLLGMLDNTVGTSNFIDSLLDGLATQLPSDTPRTVDGIVSAVANIVMQLDAHEDASTPAFDEIAKLCGCPEWEYPGQVVRDVEDLVRQRDNISKTLQTENQERTKDLHVMTQQGKVIDELREKLRVAEAVRDDARASSQRYLDEKREVVRELGGMRQSHDGLLRQLRDEQALVASTANERDRMLDTGEKLRAARPTDDDLLHAVESAHARDCGTKYRGCAPSCPFDLAQKIARCEVPGCPGVDGDGCVHTTGFREERVYDTVTIAEPACTCSAKYLELASGTHAKYCALAGAPLPDGRKRWRCGSCKLIWRAADGETMPVVRCIRCGHATTEVAQ